VADATSSAPPGGCTAPVRLSSSDANPWRGTGSAAAALALRLVRLDVRAPVAGEPAFGLRAAERPLPSVAARPDPSLPAAGFVAVARPGRALGELFAGVAVDAAG